MLKITGIAAATLLCSLLLKDKNRAFAITISVAGACALFFTVTGKLTDVINDIIDFSSGFNSSLPYIKTMLKALGITLCSQIVSDICRDNGENALASVIELSAKVLIITMIIPLLEAIISIINGLVK